jgi:putative ABC transport system substrate-binding protein
LKRREFITLIGGAAAWPLAVRAQQPSMPVVGFLAASPNGYAERLRVFRQGLKDSGLCRGRECDDRIPVGRKLRKQPDRLHA